MKMNTHKVLYLKYIKKINSIFILYQNSDTIKVMSLDDKKPKLNLDFRSRIEEDKHYSKILSFDFQPVNSLLSLSVDTKMMFIFKVHFDVLSDMGFNLNVNYYLNSDGSNKNKPISINSKISNFEFQNILGRFPIVIHSTETMIPIKML